jgi:hypothetical protein
MVWVRTGRFMQKDMGELELGEALKGEQDRTSDR